MKISSKAKHSLKKSNILKINKLKSILTIIRFGLVLKNFSNIAWATPKNYKYYSQKEDKKLCKYRKKSFFFIFKELLPLTHSAQFSRQYSKIINIFPTSREHYQGLNRSVIMTKKIKNSRLSHFSLKTVYFLYELFQI